MAPGRLIVLGGWFGLLAGMSDIALRLIQLFVLDERIYLSRQFVWMGPLADVVLYGAVGALVAAGQFILPRRIGMGVLVFAGTLLLVGAPLVVLDRLHIAAVLLVATGIAYQAARLARAHAGLVWRLMRGTLAPMMVAVLLIAVGVNGWLRWEERRRVAALPEAAADQPNILLIILDTVRAASLRLYGYGRETTPNLDRLAADAVVFDHAIATAPWTLPSHASMFTGEFPDRLDADWKSPLGGDYPTLAEILSSRGYRTGGFSANLLYATWETGLERGFTHYTDYPVSIGLIIKSSFSARVLVHRIAGLFGIDVHLVQRRADSVTDAFIAWLNRDAEAERPFFAFLNFFDAHDPYAPAAPFDTLFGGVEPMTISLADPFEGEELDRARDAYDAEIASIDHALGVLMEELDRRGLLDRTVIVVTGDHGEQFGEHGLVSHANSLYMPLLHVPLIVRPPGGDGGQRVAETVSLADVPVTILDIAGVTGATIPGTPLLGRGRTTSQAVRPARSFVSRTINMPDWLPASRGNMVSVVAGSLHYIRNGDGREELFDLTADPAEARNVADAPAFSRRLERMRALAAGESSGWVEAYGRYGNVGSSLMERATSSERE